MTSIYYTQNILHLFSAKGILMREAVRLFREAAVLGDPEDLWNLGWGYLLGQGMPKNTDHAISCWSRAAQMGHEAAKVKLSETQ